MIALLTTLLFTSCLMFYFALQVWQKKRALALRVNQYSQLEQKAFNWRNILHLLPVTDKDREQLGLLLLQAGFRKQEAIFILIALKLLGLILIPLCIYAFHQQGINLELLAKCTLGGLIASMSPEWWLKNKAKQNREKMRTATPDAVDLMVICAESGLHLDAILKKVGEEISGWSAQLSEELLFTCAQLNMGLARPEALENLAKRINSEEFNHLVSALIQSDRYGTPLVKTLKDLAQDIRRLRSLSTEERMGKVPARMSLPLMIFVLFPLVVLLAGPAMISLVRSLQGM